MQRILKLSSFKEPPNHARYLYSVWLWVDIAQSSWRELIYKRRSILIPPGAHILGDKLSLLGGERVHPQPTTASNWENWGAVERNPRARRGTPAKIVGIIMNKLIHARCMTVQTLLYPLLPAVIRWQVEGIMRGCLIPFPSQVLWTPSYVIQLPKKNEHHENKPSAGLSGRVVASHLCPIVVSFTGFYKNMAKRRGTNCVLTDMALLALTVTIAAYTPGCDAADRPAFIVGAGSRVVSSKLAGAFRNQRSRKPGNTIQQQ